jgi:hypothetical protein
VRDPGRRARAGAKAIDARHGAAGRASGRDGERGLPSDR